MVIDNGNGKESIGVEKGVESSTPFYTFNPNISREEFKLLTMEDKLNWLYDMAQIGKIGVVIKGY